MRYKLLGKSGLRVSEICLGTMTFGEDWNWGSPKDEARKIFDAYVEEGGNFFDTANFYTNGTSETYLGEFIKNDREKFVVATKYSLSLNPDDPNSGGNHRKNLMQSLNASLKRLNTDYVDLFWLHIWDSMTPVEEVMRAMDDMVRMGKVLYVGISDTPAWIVAEANTMAELKGWSPFVALQLEYSLIQRTIEQEFFPLSKAFDLALTAWSPLGMGVLTGKYLHETPTDARFGIDERFKSRYFNDKNNRIVETVLKIANEIGRSPSQVALNWVRQQRPNIIPIIGARKLDHLKDNLACLNFELTFEQLEELKEVSQFEIGFPQSFLSNERTREILFGNTYSKIDNHRK